MDILDSSKVTTPGRNPSSEEQLSQLFGSYKAEWLRGSIYELFKAPNYFPELLTARPCILVGGRGTGKTSVLKSLSYEGQFALAGRDVQSIRDAQFYGFYYRVDTNRVTAFRGPELDEDRWTRHFGHYLNLLLCNQVLRFTKWYESQTGAPLTLSPEACAAVALSLNLPPCRTLQEVGAHLNSARIQFEAHINNVADGPHSDLSLQGAPLECLFEALSALDEFDGKLFFFLIDEYENFEDYQQKVVNTLLKHSGHLHTFKIGVKELGWRMRTTLNENEQLISPSDYVRIDIAERLGPSEFASFALSVCNERIARIDPRPALSIDSLLPGLSEDEEAEVQSIKHVASEILASVRAELSPEDEELVGSMSPLFIYFIDCRRQADEVSFGKVLRDYKKAPEEWESHFKNYKYALLFTLKRGKRGIRKYYSGWNTLVLMAAGNIRYLLELVVESLLLNLREGGVLGSPVSPKVQTMAAQRIGRNNLSELEGLSVYGAHLTKLVLGLGRVFQVMALDSIGHAPEVNQFYVGSARHTEEEEQKAASLLDAAVMHLALLRTPGNKLQDHTDTREFDYAVHPVFSAFFEFSHRRKRKVQLSVRQLLGLVHAPKETIKEVLAANNRVSEESLPEQALLFATYYGAE